MITFRQFLNEVFDKPLPYEKFSDVSSGWGKNKTYRFPVNDTDYIYVSLYSNERQDEINFYRADRNHRGHTSDMVGSRDAIKVMSTVIKILKDEKSKGGFKAPSIRFSADSRETGRVAIYTRLAKQIVKDFGYKSYTDNWDEDDDYVIFTVYK